MEQVPSLSLVNTLITECKQGLQDRIYIYLLKLCLGNCLFEIRNHTNGLVVSKLAPQVRENFVGE